MRSETLTTQESDEIFSLLWNRLKPYRDHIRNHRAILSFSGGKDSMILYQFYKYLVASHRIPLPILFYMNHGIRDNHEEVLGIHKFLQNSEWEWISIDRNIPLLSSRLGKSLEETGRLFRYRYLNRIGKGRYLKGSNPNTYITTGHHNEDYIESILIHWIRGGGESALNTLPTWDGNNLRPLVLLEDKELHRLYELFQKNAFEDESNSNNVYLRNRIRNTILPFLRSEGMNLKRLHSNFHEDISIGRQKVFHRSSNGSYPAGNIDMIEYLTLPSSTLLAIQSPRDWKILLDIHLRLLGLHPARRTTIEETFPMLGRDSPSTHMTGEFYLYIHNRHGAFIANRNSSLFRSPKYSYTIGTPHIRTEWGGKKYNLDLRSKQLAIHHAYDPISDYSVTPPNPGEKIFLGCSHKEISELLRVRGIPPFVRKTFPILRKNNVALQILFELFDPQSKLSE